MLLGVQAWTFHQFTALEAIERTAMAGGRCIEFFPGQKISPDLPDTMGPDMGPRAASLLRAQLEKYNVGAVAFGVTGISKDEASADRLFKWVKSMGIGIIQTESTDAIDTIEKMVAKYDVKVGFHNHPRTKDPNYKVWNPAYVLELVKNRDKRIGSCADTGHWVRSGIKPIDALRVLKGRIVSSHLKDLNVFAPEGHDVPYGSGVSDVPAILEELRRQKFSGSISVEYEYNWQTSIPEVAQCLGFVRGYARSKGW